MKTEIFKQGLNKCSEPDKYLYDGTMKQLILRSVEERYEYIFRTVLPLAILPQKDPIKLR